LNYLLFLRLIPLFPFFLINLVSGLTPLPLRTFFLGTVVGIVPGTFLYVNAGHQLTTIEKPGDLLSRGVILALVLLGLFSLLPVAYRRLRRRA
ncbi:MAG TPA: VTT domain-containing protein, partial [bacterium]|nr:VTT domain-containing protein [bacterium]